VNELISLDLLGIAKTLKKSSICSLRLCQSYGELQKRIAGSTHKYGKFPVVYNMLSSTFCSLDFLGLTLLQKTGIWDFLGTGTQRCSFHFLSKK
jgi:hypothetical protein